MEPLVKKHACTTGEYLIDLGCNLLVYLSSPINSIKPSTGFQKPSEPSEEPLLAGWIRTVNICKFRETILTYLLSYGLIREQGELLIPRLSECRQAQR